MGNQKSEEVTRNGSRHQVIVRTSLIGILANVLLAGFKAAVGMLSHSIAITLDAVNNLSDALSSIITIVGTKLAGKRPDKKHPMGYGRIEYLTATVIAFIVLYAGVTALKESVSAILHPAKPDYTALVLVIVAVGVLVKVALGRFVKATGERVHSDSLIASGTDATMDAVISASTLAAAGIYLAFGLSLEAWLGAIIAVVIIKSGIDMLRETLSEILGERVQKEKAREIKATVESFPEVQGAYDLFLHNYGPDFLIGSVHVAVPDTMTAGDIDKLTRRIMHKVHAENGVLLEGVGIYSVNTKDPKVMTMRDAITAIVADHDHILQTHGFYVDEGAKSISMDVVIDFAAPDAKAILNDIQNRIEAIYPDYTVRLARDFDISD
jgi:cation diffusion facilitator family transporter